MKVEKTSFWILLGPFLLLSTTLLLLAKTASLLGRPVWIVGIMVSLLLATFVSLLAFIELKKREEENAFEGHQVENKCQELRSVLDETHHLYREKVSKLEKEISSIQEDKGSLLKKKEEELANLRSLQIKLQQEFSQQKNQASDFQIALDDALDELRALRQQHYFDLQTEKKVPRDLIHQHQQLRAQFEEKSAVLDQTRKRLFFNEGYLLAIQKSHELSRQERDQEELILIEEIGALLNENKALEKEVALLERLVSESHPPKKETTPQRKKVEKKLEQILELQFEETKL